MGLSLIHIYCITDFQDRDEDDSTGDGNSRPKFLIGSDSEDEVATTSTLDVPSLQQANTVRKKSGWCQSDEEQTDAPVIDDSDNQNSISVQVSSYITIHAFTCFVS